MAAKGKAVSLEERIAAFKSVRGDSVATDEVGAVVASLVSSLEGTAETARPALQDEANTLLAILARAQDELTALGPRMVGERDIPSARDELNAVVVHTEAAAGRMMDMADTLRAMAAQMSGSPADELSSLSTQIFETSSFQDITGQRIAKVINLLHHIEKRLAGLADAIGDTVVEQEPRVFGVDGALVGTETLKHGPQLDGRGNSQADIDALLTGFD